MYTNPTSRAEAQGNGVATNFPVSLQVYDVSHLKVWRFIPATQELALLVRGTDYNLTLNSDFLGCQVQFIHDLGGGPVVFAPPSGQEFVFLRVVPYTQEQDLRTYGATDKEGLERQIDLAFMAISQLAEVVDRCAKLDVTYGPGSGATYLAAIQAQVALAVSARAAAQAAQGAAETAQRLSEDAWDAAVIAQGLAEDARDAARAATGVDIKAYGAVGDGTTDDTAAIQAAIDDANGRPVYIPPGIYGVTDTITLQAPLHLHGAGNGVDDAMTTLEGSWLKLLSTNTLTSGACLLDVTHVAGGVDNRTFALVERIGLYGDRASNAYGDGMSVSAKNVKLRDVSVIQFPQNGITCRDKDDGPADNDGMNASIFEDLWVGYNSGHGLNLTRDHYSGDFIVRGGHYHWNDDAGIYCNQVNVLFDGAHVWWNKDGIIIDGSTNGIRIAQTCRIYDNAAAGVRLINTPKNLSIAGDIHGNGNETRWTYFDPALTSSDITEAEQAGIYCNTAAINVVVDDVHFGYLNETGRQKYGLKIASTDARFVIGTLSSDGAGATQWNRIVSAVSGATNVIYHANHGDTIHQHPGFGATGDVKMNGHSMLDTDTLSFWTWDVATVTGEAGSEVCALTNSIMVFTSASALDVYRLSMAGLSTTRIPLIVFRNGGAGTVTFHHSTTSLRLLGAANKAITTHNAIGFIAVSETVYQQIF